MKGKWCGVRGATCIVRAAACLVLGATAIGAGQPTATIQKPKALTVTGGRCLVAANGVLGVNIGPNAAMPTVALTVGPGPMADAMNANKAKFTGPGKYDNEIVALYLGKTATEDVHIGLGTVTINADGKSGSFALKDGSGVGAFDCGVKP